MSNQTKKLEVKNLVKTLKNNKDAVIIVGDKCVSNSILKIDENTKDKFSRKSMVKKPKDFWEYYKNTIFNQEKLEITKAEEAINKLINTGLIKTVINLNYTGNLTKMPLLNADIIELKGNVRYCRCMSCENKYRFTDDMLNSKKVLRCECGGKIAPTMIMFGEKYREEYISNIKNAIFKEENGKVELNTHCLIFIGVDFEEDYVHDIMESYNAIKMQTEAEESYTVMICEMDGVSIEYYQPEFATYEDIAGAVERLIVNLEE